MKKLNLPFYLTGGTALSRFYFNHRFSDDLDLFVNNDINFSLYVAEFYRALLDKNINKTLNIDEQRISRSENHAQFFVVSDSLELKIDFVNDVASHYGEFKKDSSPILIDSLRNILSNKFSAIFRYEVKDIVDIWIICKNFKCDFKEIIQEAKTKEAGTDPVAIYDILNSFPSDKLDLLRWIKKPNVQEFNTELLQIAGDILLGNENSLAK